jgi:ABC-type oligopeptide transport system ATPase subunit
LLGIDADPIQSKEHILISKILANSWSKRKNLDIADLIRHIQSPVFTKIGVFDIDTFFPVKERMKLAMSLNNLLASPGFEIWMEGAALDVNRFLYTPEGKAKISIFSIAHLSDTERMFFVSLLLNEMVSWMRTQDGTSSLRALLYMDEIYGYFPPSASPPSKTPMLTLLKQARAFGLGVLLSTQNPVDLDYKGLSNAGTWFIGRLQTDRDKQRMLDGLEGVDGGANSLSRSELDNLISSLGKRKFLMHNVHESKPAVFNTRWVLSYLRGPLTSSQVQELMKNRKQAEQIVPGKQEGLKEKFTESREQPEKINADKPLLPPGIIEKYRPPEKPKPEDSTLFYRPEIFCKGKLHFVSAKARLDYWKDLSVFAYFPEESSVPLWDEASALVLNEIKTRLAYLIDVGIGYLTLERQSRTLSSGELQRVALTSALGSSLVNTLYILDEPSIGLHPRDNRRLINIFKRLRDLQNTVIVVEHDPEIISESDFMLDLGPGAGEKGGEVQFPFNKPTGKVITEPCKIQMHMVKQATFLTLLVCNIQQI